MKLLPIMARDTNCRATDFTTSKLFYRKAVKSIKRRTHVVDDPDSRRCGDPFTSVDRSVNPVCFASDAGLAYLDHTRSATFSTITKQKLNKQTNQLHNV